MSRRGRKTPLPLGYIIAGSLLSAVAGLVLGLFALVIVLLPHSAPTEGGFCSKDGIGWHEARSPDKVVAYVDEGWSGFPPNQRCKVYLVDTADESSRLPDAGSARREPAAKRLLTEGTYPGAQAYAWVVAALFLPPAIWLVLMAIAWSAERQRAIEARRGARWFDPT
ncbi:MAG TPA: hypothetical protein VMT37_11920 [Solirubrobacterales bacterium]|nr:hypothetical protein [Solirubrobacterales bacterium]